MLKMIGTILYRYRVLEEEVILFAKALCLNE